MKNNNDYKGVLVLCFMGLLAMLKSGFFRESGWTRKAREKTEHAYRLIGRGHLRRAERVLREAVDIDSGYAEAQSKYGWVLAKLGRDLDVAEAHVRFAVELEPKNPRFWEDLSAVYLKKGELRCALVAVLRAEEIYPKKDPGVELVNGTIRDAMGISAEGVREISARARELYDEVGLRSRGRLMAGALKYLFEGFKRGGGRNE